MDAVGLAIARTQQAWSQKMMVGALLMDVTAAFPRVAKDCLVRRMKDLGLDENLIQWTDSFIVTPLGLTPMREQAKLRLRLC